MSAALERLLRAGFGGEVPERVRLLSGDAELEALEDFQLSLVFPFAGGARVAASDRADPVAWERLVRDFYPEAGDFWVTGRAGRPPAGTRRMIDTDGSERADLYLDDLGDAPAGFPDAPPGPLIAATLHLPERELSFLTRQSAPPLAELPGEARRAAERLLELGARGLWGSRVRRQAVCGFLWVSESRWRKDADATRAIVEALDPPPAWWRARDVVTELGWKAYPDALEWTERGLEVTLGVTR